MRRWRVMSCWVFAALHGAGSAGRRRWGSAAWAMAVTADDVNDVPVSVVEAVVLLKALWKLRKSLARRLSLCTCNAVTLLTRRHALGYNAVVVVYGRGRRTMSPKKRSPLTQLLLLPFEIVGCFVQLYYWAEAILVAAVVIIVVIWCLAAIVGVSMILFFGR